MIQTTTSLPLGPVLDALPAGVLVTDPRGRVLRANAGFLTLFGYAADEVIGRSIGDLAPPASHRAEARDALTRFLAGEHVRVEGWRFRRDGTAVAVAFVGGPVEEDGAAVARCAVYQDVTDHWLLAEEALRAASLHRATLESTADGLLVVDTAGRSLSFNRRFLEMWSIPDEVAVAGSDAEKLRYAAEQVEDSEGFLARVRALYADPETASYDEIRLRDGRIFERYSQPQRVAGRSVGRVWSFRDVTAQRRAQAALEESQRLLELFFSQSLDGFFFMMLDEPVRWDDTVDKEAVLDYVFAHHRITKVNDAMLAQYGARRDQFLGLTPNDLYAHDIAHGRAVWRRFFDEGRLHVETDERTLDGRPIVIEGDYICLYDAEGRIIGHFGIQRDVTERKRAEEALRLSEEKFEKAFRCAPVRVSIATLAEGRFLEVNDTFLRELGFEREQVIGRTALELGLWGYPEERERLVERLRREGAVRDYEFSGQLRDGERHISSLSAEVIEMNGEPCMVAAAYDVTERRRAEADLWRSRQELRALAVRLQSIREDERTRIAREIHDELGQALTGLKMDMAWLASRLRNRPALHERVQAVLGRIDGTMASVRRIATELRPSVLDHLGLVAAVEWQAQEFERRTGIAVTLDLCADELAVADGPATTVFRILQEALTNVARHAQATTVRISLAVEAGALTLQVRDDGRGITDAELTNLRSLGLIGLRERAAACGGELSIRGLPGQGTTVTAWIPVGPGPDREAAS